MAIDSWLTPSTKSGKGNTNISVTAAKNPGASRSTIVSIKTTGITRTVECIQVEADIFRLTISSKTLNSSGSVITNVGQCSIGGNAAGGVLTNTYYRDSVDTVTAAAAPTGYDFLGWYEGSNLISSSLQFSVTMNANRTIEARYKIKTFVVNASSESTDYGTVSPSGQTIEYGAQATVTATPKAAYNFAGWYNGATRVSANASYTFGVTANVNLVAKFTIKTFTTTTANSTGGTASVNVGSVNYGGSATWTASPTTGYHFVRWSTGSTANPLTVNSITANTHITPVFEINTYTVSFNGNGGTSPAAVSKTHGATIGTLPTSSRASTAEYNYVFLGWSTSSGGSVNVSASTTITGNTTFYAVWRADRRSYTVTFNANGGSGGGSQSIAYGSTVASYAAPTKTGYTFTGWWTAASGGTKVSFPATVYGNITYYAQWSINTYTLYYNANGGSVSPANKAIAYGGAYGTLPTPTRSADAQYTYTFAGWFTAASGGSQVSSNTTIGAGNVTIYAHWTPNIRSYTFTFNANGGNTPSSTSITKTYGSAVGTLPTVSRSSSVSQNFTFVGWFDTSAASGGTQLTTSTQITSNKTWYARWSASTRQYTISVGVNNSGMGTATGGGTYNYGATATLTATAKSGYRFVNWSDGNTSASRSVTVSGNASYTANFEAIPYLNLDKDSITFEASGGTQTVNVSSNVSWSVS